MPYIGGIFRTLNSQPMVNDDLQTMCIYYVEIGLMHLTNFT
jgi:hypothetical protein